MKKTISGLFILTFALAASNCTKDYQPTTTAKKTQMKKTKKMKTSSSSSIRSSKTMGGISVIKATVCRSIDQRNPVGEGSQFSSDVGRLYAFTKVGLDATQETSIKHVWIYNNQELASVTLPVRGPQWRTYSSKAIDPMWKGDWKVNVVTSNNEVLHSIKFKIE